MANRILIGNHPNHGQVLYVAPTGGNVLASDKSSFLFDSTVATHSQLLCWKEVTTTSSQNGGTVSFTYNSHGVRNFAVAFASQISDVSETASDISCISESANTERASASYSLFGGSLGGVNSTTDKGNDITFTIALTNSGSTGTCTISRSSPSSSSKDFLVNVMIFKEEA